MNRAAALVHHIIFEPYIPPSHPCCQDPGKFGAKRKHEELNDELLALIKVKNGGLAINDTTEHNSTVLFRGVLSVGLDCTATARTSLLSRSHVRTFARHEDTWDIGFQVVTSKHNDRTLYQCTNKTVLTAL